MKFTKLLFLKQTISKLALILFAWNFFIPNAKAEMEPFIESTAQFFTQTWLKTPGFELITPPQIISLNPDSKSLIGCKSENNQKILEEVHTALSQIQFFLLMTNYSFSMKKRVKVALHI